MLVGSIDAPSVPVGPINKLVEHGHGKGINGRADDDFSIGPRKMRSLNLLSNGRTKSTLPVCVYTIYREREKERKFDIIL